jgi:hypothetical protein
VELSARPEGGVKLHREPGESVMRVHMTAHVHVHMSASTRAHAHVRAQTHAWTCMPYLAMSYVMFALHCSVGQSSQHVCVVEATSQQLTAGHVGGAQAARRTSQLQDSAQSLL